MPPTVFLGQRGDEGPWAARDRELAKALDLYEASVCKGCGHSVHETYDPDREGWYQVEVETCAACRAKEMHGKDEKPEPGQKMFVVLDPTYKKRD